MFYCNNCRKERNWPESIVKSMGACEICETVTECHDKASKYLPPTKEPVPHIVTNEKVHAAFKDMYDGMLQGETMEEYRERIHNEFWGKHSDPYDPEKKTGPGLLKQLAEEIHEESRGYADCKLADEVDDKRFDRIFSKGFLLGLIAGWVSMYILALILFGTY